MSATIKIDELPVILEELNNEKKLMINIGIWLEGTAFCFFMGLLGIGIWLKLKFLQIYAWKWGVLGLVIISNRLVSYWIVKIILYLLELNRFCRVRVLFFIAKEKNSLHMFFWSVIVFSVWCILMYHPVKSETKIIKIQYVKLSLLILMISCFIWLMMSILFKAHKTRCLSKLYFNKVTKSILEQCILRMLMSSSPDYQDHEISKFNELSLLNKEDVSFPIVDKLMTMVGDRSLPSVEAVVTKSILQNIMKLGSRSSHAEKIKKFLFEQSALTINLFEGDDITEKTLHLWVVSAFKDRQALMSDMKKTKTAIEQLHLVVATVVGFIILNTWLYLTVKSLKKL